MNSETWPPPPEGQRSREPIHYRGGGIDVRVDGGSLALRHERQKSYCLVALCALTAFMAADTIFCTHQLVGSTAPHFRTQILTMNGVVTVLLWLILGFQLNRPLFRFGRDGSVVIGGLISKRVGGAQYVKLRLGGKDTRGLDCIVIGFDTAQQRSKWNEFSPPWLQPNEICVTSSKIPVAVEHVAHIIGEFLGVPVISE